jgi:hypothetical protein
MKSFSVSHVSSLLKYMGVSFIAGAVAHGAFSETRSVVTAAIGIGAYMLGAYLQSRNDGGERLTWSTVIGAGALSALGIGFFTGGLQHFPDSPSRSVWVVPVGFLLSAGALAMSWNASIFGSGRKRSSILVYILTGFVVVGASSVGAWSYLKDFGGGDGHDHHHHGSSHDNIDSDAENHHE